MKRKRKGLWENYTEERFRDNGAANHDLGEADEGTTITKNAVVRAVKKIKNNKGCGPDEVLAEILKTTKRRH